MEEVSGLEMPSPKRLRVEAPNLPHVAESPRDLDDFDDIYGTPSQTEETKTFDVLLSPPEKGTATLEPVPALPSLPGLTGLGIVNTSTSPPVIVEDMQTEESAKSGLEDSTQADEYPSKTHDTIRAEEHPSNADSLLPNINGSEDAAKSSISTHTEITSVHGPMTLPPTAESQEVISTAEELLPGKARPLNSPPSNALPPIASPSSALPSNALPPNPLPLNAPPPMLEAAEPLDPLAFLEASLPPESSGNVEEQEGMVTADEEGSKNLADAPTFEELAMANKQSVDAEFEIDSSPLNSDTDSSDDTTSSDDSDDVDYKMLDPEEQARRLMAEDGGSDDDGPKKASGPLRTQNEKPDEVVPKPDVVVTGDMRIEELGTAEGTVENVVLIKAKVSGEYQVLEQGSVLCLENRSVVGVVAETLGRVQQPYYSVRFTNVAAIAEAGIAKDTKIFYVEHLSTSVFTQPLRAFKGSDASNLHDEEVGDEELEFSDDEAEAEHKRRVKMQRQQKRTGRDGPAEGFSRGPRGGRGGFGRGGGKRGGYFQDGTPSRHSIQEEAPTKMGAALDYDGKANDMDIDGEDLYTPLARPTNLHEVMGSQAGFSENLGLQRSGINAAHGRGRGRGDRGGGRSSGNGRGQGRGSFRGRGGNSNQQRPNTHLPSPLQKSSDFPQPPAQQYPPSLYPIATSTQQQPFSPFQSQHTPPQWNQSPTYQYPPQQYNTDACPAQQQYPSYPQPDLTNPNSNIPAGTHINPAFFRQPQQQPQQPQQWPHQQ